MPYGALLVFAQVVITVTATRTETRLADTASSVVVLSRDDLEKSAAPVIDDALRQVPGFTLFRRAGSRTANPTTQGPSLRGIGASGAARAAVLDDGIPLNDPFGGWVYWGRVTSPALERVEVVRGGASDLYGSGAMGGVIQFVRRSDPAVAATLSGGSQGTGTVSAYAAMQRGAWRAALASGWLTTRGWIAVDPRSRGAVDRAAGSRHVNGDATVARGGMFLRASRYEESRNNGTPLQTNATSIRQLAAGATSGGFQGRAWVTHQDYAQTFSSIAANRNSERLTSSQRVPSRGAGASAQWGRPLGTRHVALVGAELRGVSGASLESTRVEGRQRTAAIFFEDVIAVSPRLGITAALRADDWRNFDAKRDGVALASRRNRSWSPRLSLLLRPAEGVSLTASAYRAFRAPTLNELVRPFRVGNVMTLANERLGPETLSAVEAGARVRIFRATAFFARVEDTVANVTLQTTPSLITRQRQNLGETRTRGIEVEGDWRLPRSWRISAGYLFSDARVTAGALNGRRLPQVPRQQATLQASWAGPRVAWAAQTRWSSMQFDDDRNELPLRGALVSDLTMSMPLSRGLALTASVENLFDRRIEVSATPVITLGQPRAFLAGIRVAR